MIRIIFGFFLGCIFTFYSFPLVQTALTQVGIIEEKARSSFETDEPVYTLNPNPPISLVREHKFEPSNNEADELKRIMKAISIAKAAPQDSKTPDFVINLIRDFVKINPNIGFYVRERIQVDGINNKEALEIISKYLSEQ